MFNVITYLLLFCVRTLLAAGTGKLLSHGNIN